nr:PREDICTED: peroxisome proliferator-activated receptor gamma coactivator-related protein 1-like isoform X1 [Paralichthys olivaceus]
MWCSKMAARWMGKEAELNADGSDFLTHSFHHESLLSRGDVDAMDSQSCADHSILSIFEDATVITEDKSGVEEESESLLSALTEMLDSVGDDEGTLSPFDVLPDTKLLSQQRCRDNPVVISLRPTAQPTSPNVTFSIKTDGNKEDENKIHLLTQQSPILLKSKSRADNEVEVFTSTSLVNLVRLMHPYCLKLYVEEGSKERKDHTLFSQEEVWRYERPTEENDEEINVVSDDEEPVKEMKGKEEKKDGKPLRSVLLNGNSQRAPSSREKKRVSFGPVQVVSFNEPVEKRLNETNLTSGNTSETVSVPLNSSEALGNLAESTLEPQTEMNSDKANDLPAKGETKAKSLSLQQYRQLRQKRQPLVEKQANNTTKWPSVAEPPKELTPIFNLHGQRQSSCGPKTVSHHASLSMRPPEVKPSSHLHHRGLKRPRPEAKTISPASPLPDNPTDPNGKVPEGTRSPAKKPTLISIDPPNPVLVPLPVSQTAPPSTAPSSSESKVEFHSTNSDLDCTTHLHKSQNKTSATPLQRQPSSSEPQPRVLFVSQDGTARLQEIKHNFTQIVSDLSSAPLSLCPATTQTEPASECHKPQPQTPRLSPTKQTVLEPKTPQAPSADTVMLIKCPSSTPPSALPPSQIDVPTPIKKKVPEISQSTSSPEETPSSLQVGCRAQNAASDSGIEAPDVTSLLEQFEETQAKEERVCENEPDLSSTTLLSNLPTDGCMQPVRNLPVGPESRLLPSPSVEALEPLSNSESSRTLKPLRNLPQLQMSERVDIPEPLGTEIILSSQQGQPARRKKPPSKAIQIIDPRPLRSRKTHISTSEAPAAHTPPHMYLFVCSDHDYCGSVDHLLTSGAHRNRVRPSSLQDISQITQELQVTPLHSGAAAESKTQTSTGQTKPASQHHSEQRTNRSETNPSTCTGLQFSDGGASEKQAAPCTLPTPPPSPPDRGRDKRRYMRRSPISDSSSSSCRSSSSSSSSSSSASRSPKRQRLHHRRSESSSCSSSPCRSISHSPPRRYRLSYSRSRCSRSRSRSWSQSRSRSPSPKICQRQWKDVYSRESKKLRREHEIRIQKLKAIDERRVVYVGRIRRSMTHEELRERFSQFGEVECVTLHFRDRGDHYGFVTFYNMKDAFAAIENGGKLRKPDELPFDICFGGRRQFCNSNYSDLDANRDAEPSPAKSRFEDLDFDSLLKQAQRGLKR